MRSVVGAAATAAPCAARSRAAAAVCKAPAARPCCCCAHYNHHHRQQQHLSSRPHQHQLHGGSGSGEARQRLRPSCALSGIADPAGDLPPYARLSTPVYSLSSRGPGSNGRATLNLVTYASPIAIQPARKFVLGLYVGTASWANVRAERRAVLQLLRERHGALVPLLGKQSGRDIDKPAALQERGFELADAFGLPVLADHAGAIELRVAGDFIDCGDHEVVVCDVAGWVHGSEDKDNDGAGHLYTGYLRSHGLL